MTRAAIDTTQWAPVEGEDRWRGLEHEAASRRTAPSRLAEIFNEVREHKPAAFEVWVRLSLNPRTPAEVLFELIEDLHPHPLYGSRAHCRYVARNPALPRVLVLALQDDDEGAIRDEAQRWGDPPSGAPLSYEQLAIEGLVSSERPLMRYLAAVSPRASNAQLIALARDPEPRVRRGVARNRVAPTEAQRLLLKGDEIEWLTLVRLDARYCEDMADPRTSVREMAAIYQRCRKRPWLRSARRALVASPKITVPLLRALDESDVYDGAETLAANPAVLRILARRDGAGLPAAVVIAIAECGTDAEVLRRLAKDPDAMVRMAVATNRATPPDALRGLLLEGNPPQDTCAWPELARNPSTPEDVLGHLAEQHDGRDYFGRGTVEQNLLMNPRLPSALRARIERLDEDEEEAAALDGRAMRAIEHE